MPLTLRPPVLVPLFGLGGTLPGKGRDRIRKLNDRGSFEITQNAEQHVASGVGSAEPAIDIGNGHCGDPIVAMAAGVARRVIDGAGALGIRIEHAGGLSTEYWHLAEWVAADGARVEAGTIVGKLGNTGLGGICHCHVMVKLAGKAIDPEPLVFGRAVDVIGEEVDVLTQKTRPLRASIRITTGKGTGIRTDTRAAPETLDSRTANDQNEFTAIGIAPGEEFPEGSGNRNWFVFLKRGVGLRAIHSGVCEEVPVADAAPRGARNRVRNEPLSRLDDLLADEPPPEAFEVPPVHGKADDSGRI